MLDLSHLTEEITSKKIEVLLADRALVPTSDIPILMRRLGINRPLILIGDPGVASGVPRDVSCLERPVTRQSLLLSVALALAEGRPARRSPRRMVQRLASSVDGVGAYLLDVSAEGVRLEVAGTRPGILPPYFALRVPGFGVRASVKRVWVAAPSSTSLWCGGTIEGVLPGSEQPWTTFVDEAPTASAAFAIEPRVFR
jgi:hypothetical protein